MRRRDFLAAGCCGCLASLAPGIAFGQEWSAPPQRFSRPDISTDEGGLWALVDREETRLRRSPFTVRDPGLHEYVQDLACRLGGDHCPDIRVHLVHTPLFNASMAPNGMMQVWTGLLLRAENEAQLAAVLGHEIGHYLARHQIAQLRDTKSRSAFGQFLGLFGAVGAIGQLAMLAGMFAYSRDHEREADRIGASLMRRAGYDIAEASKIWDNMLLELKAHPGGDPAKTSPMFATHPPADERRDTLAKLAQASPGGDSREEALLNTIKPFRREWLEDEVKRGQYEESLALLGRMTSRWKNDAELVYARGETYRLRAKDGDLDCAIADYRQAVSLGGEPAETHRGLGMIYRARKQLVEEQASFARYLELAPGAPDALMIKSYMEVKQS